MKCLFGVKWKHISRVVAWCVCVMGVGIHIIAIFKVTKHVFVVGDTFKQLTYNTMLLYAGATEYTCTYVLGKK